MKELKINNMVKLCVLAALYHKPEHGYEMIKHMQQRMGRKASPGQIYPFLQLLRRLDYVRIEKRGAREKKIFALTPAGRKFVKSAFERFGNLIELAIKPRLSECAHCGCAVYRGSYRAKRRGKTLAFCCVSCARSY